MSAGPLSTMKMTKNYRHWKAAFRFLRCAAKLRGAKPPLRIFTKSTANRSSDPSAPQRKKAVTAPWERGTEEIPPTWSMQEINDDAHRRPVRERKLPRGISQHAWPAWLSFSRNERGRQNSSPKTLDEKFIDIWFKKIKKWKVMNFNVMKEAWTYVHLSRKILVQLIMGEESRSNSSPMLLNLYTDSAKLNRAVQRSWKSSQVSASCRDLAAPSLQN